MSVDITALKAAQAKGLTVGVIPSDGTQALRLEIDDLLQDEDLANLYFLALEAFQSDPESSKAFSFFEISGIHGQPYRPWNNVSSVPFPSGTTRWDKGEGYCSHGSVIFPTWHRAYLAQFEQAIFLYAADIAKNLGQTDVLARYRIPYFDPLLPRQKFTDENSYGYGLPLIFTLPQIRVFRSTTPTKKWELAPNPLYSFKFPSQPGNGWDWESVFGNNYNPLLNKQTVRGYDGSRSQGTFFNHSFVVQTFDNNYNPDATRSSSDAQSVWRLLLGSENWITMSNHYDPTNRRTQNYNMNSLEGFHDDIHTYLGSGPGAMARQSTGGHMSYPPTAGFDPIFWLHHCNVDRLLAIWQGIHSQDPDSIAWWTTLSSFDGTFVEPPHVGETPAINLAPFRKSINAQGSVTWWNSGDTRNHLKLGYDYPQTYAARTQAGGDSAKNLTAWANQELGWVFPGSQNSAASKIDLAHFEKQITTRVSAFPTQILIDGVEALDSDDQHISSLAQVPVTTASAQVTAAPLVLQSKFVAPPHVTSTSVASGSKPRSVAAAATNVSHAVAETTSKVTTQVAAALPVVTKPTVPAAIATSMVHAPATIPTKNPTFDQRFGNLGNLVADGKMTQWNISFGVDKYCLDGSFIIYFFLGDFEPDHSNWLHEPNLVGSSGIFATPQRAIEEGHCSNCASNKQTSGKYYDSIGLTQGLLTYWKSGKQSNGVGLTSLDNASVIPFLTRNLHWRVVNARCEEKDREEIPSLKIIVFSETVKLPQQLTDKPVFENQELHIDITNGRPGGLSYGEEF